MSPDIHYLARILASGPDAETFLQGQLTQDLRKLHGEPLWAGYCSPKGRLLAVLRLHRTAQGIELELPRSLLEPTLKRLRMFVMRSKVLLNEVDWTPAKTETQWRRQNIEDGVPVVHPETVDHFVPQFVNLDQLGGIAFDKGCYTGQEIVARLHYLGTPKRRMFRRNGAGAAPAPGTPVYADGEDLAQAQAQQQAVGEIVDAVDAGDGQFMALAVLQTSHQAQASLKLGTPAGPGLGL